MKLSALWSIRSDGRTANGVDSESENADRSQTQPRRESADYDVLRNSLDSRSTRIRLGHRGLREPCMDLGSGVQGDSQSSHHGSCAGMATGLNTISGATTLIVLSISTLVSVAVAPDVDI